MTRDAASPANSLRATISDLAVPAALLKSWAEPTPALERGTLWRADWNDTVALIVVTGTSPKLTVAPLSLEPSLAGHDTFRLEASESPLGVVAHAWLALEVEVGTWVLGQFVGKVGPDLNGGHPHGSSSASTSAWELPSVRLYRAILRDQCEALRSARWRLAPVDGAPSGHLRDVVSFTALTDAVGGNPRRALSIWRGQATLSDDEAQAVAAAVGIGIEQLPSDEPALPEALVAELEHPARGSQVRSVASRRGLQTEEAYRLFGAEVYALAARQTGAREPDWGLRLDAYFADAADVPGGLGD